MVDLPDGNNDWLQLEATLNEICVGNVDAVWKRSIAGSWDVMGLLTAHGMSEELARQAERVLGVRSNEDHANPRFAVLFAFDDNGMFIGLVTSGDEVCLERGVSHAAG